jgi:hypothetical protein
MPYPGSPGHIKGESPMPYMLKIAVGAAPWKEFECSSLAQMVDRAKESVKMALRERSKNRESFKMVEIHLCTQSQTLGDIIITNNGYRDDFNLLG